MTTKHIPGPWRVERQPDLDRDGNGYEWAIRATSGEYEQNPGYANTKDHAVLMAAAPELLAAAVELIENRTPVPDTESDYVVRVHVKRLFDAIRAASTD